MSDEKRIHPNMKSNLHPRNKHRSRYDFQALIAVCPALAEYVSENKYGDESINFFQPEAVKMLNKALLQRHYGIEHWDIPEGYLCPPIPGRADYIHYAADMLAKTNKGVVPTGANVKCLDIGVGANCVYPIIGHQEYDWSFIGSDIDKTALEAARQIVEGNDALKTAIELREQTQATSIFKGILETDERIDMTFCNPPFHASKEAAEEAAQRKLSNLKGTQDPDTVLNFGGQSNELWYKGGEVAFVEKMIAESRRYAQSCLWFSTLISKEKHVKYCYRKFRQVSTARVKTIPMGQGNKISRVVMWTFLPTQKRIDWANEHWQETEEPKSL